MHTHGDSFSRRRLHGGQWDDKFRMTSWSILVKRSTDLWVSTMSMRNLDFGWLWESALTSRNSWKHSIHNPSLFRQYPGQNVCMKPPHCFLKPDCTRQALPALPSIMYMYKQFIVGWLDINPRKAYPLALNLENFCTPQHSFHNISHVFF